MNKAEIQKICYKWLVKAYSTGQRVDPHDANNSEFYMPMIDLSWSPKMADEIIESNQEKKLEIDIDTFRQERKEEIDELFRAFGDFCKAINEQLDNKSNQEESNE